MTAASHPATDGETAVIPASSTVPSGVLEFVWPMYLTLVLALGAWVMVPSVLLGWQPVAITSGSMAPAIQPGHVVVVAPYRGQDLGAGAVVTYRDPQRDRLVTHRISAVAPDGTIRTRGDGNAVDDPIPLSRDRIVGVGRLVIPAAGLPALWAHEGRTELLALVAALTVVTVGAAGTAASSGARTRRERSTRRGGATRRIPVRTAVLGTVVLAALAVLAASEVSGAAFVGRADNAANAFSAGTVPAPADVTTAGTCGAPAGRGKGSKPTIDLVWSGVPGVTSYEVQRASVPEGPYAPVGAVTDSCYRDTGLNAGTTYHYQVRSVADPWTSAWSAPVSGDLNGRGA